MTKPLKNRWPLVLSIAALVVAVTMIPRRMRTTQADAVDAVSGNGSGDLDRDLVA